MTQVQELGAFDLNLLLVFNQIMREGNVTRAAERLGKTQSAVSQSLKRLRMLLKDPLFLRTQEGLVPTHRAEQLAPQVQALLDSIQTLIKPPLPFDPLRESAQLKLIMSDYSQLVILPSLLQTVAALAPNTELLVIPGYDDLEQRLLSGEAQVGFGVKLHDSPHLLQRKLLDDEIVCLIRNNHPLVQETLSLETYLQLDHILIAPRGRPGSYMDSALEAMNRTRRVVLRIPNFMAVPELIAKTDHVVLLPLRIARWWEQRLPVRVFPPPLAVPGFSTLLVWHERAHEDPCCQWFRTLVTQVCQQL